ncbi:PIF1-like helicase-domain-containing protein [Suillus cothurnatus]|nr:PIF1-like helicase-domain-containing protein [Suillus cothurnatus]
MPARYYAVRIGREGPKIYSDILDFRTAILGLSGASGKGFNTLEEAKAWLTLANVPTSGVSVAQTIASTTVTWDENYQPALMSTSATVPFESARRYPEPQPACRWIEYESPLNALQTIPNSDRLTPPPPYIPLQEAELPPLLPPPPEIELSEEQQRVLRLVESGKNIFFTGPAGTGKSVLLRAIIKLLRRKFGEVAITAPTGIAGVNIGGSTIHSWAGIGLGKETVKELVGALGPRTVKRWTDTHALVIDEISMLDGRLFDKLR